MLIKIKFIRNGEPKDREYAYRAPDDVKVGDMVELPSGKGIVTAVDVPKAEVAGYEVKEIVKIINESEE